MNIEVVGGLGMFAGFIVTLFSAQGSGGPSYPKLMWTGLVTCVVGSVILLW